MVATVVATCAYHLPHRFDSSVLSRINSYSFVRRCKRRWYIPVACVLVSVATRGIRLGCFHVLSQQCISFLVMEGYFMEDVGVTRHHSLPCHDSLQMRVEFGLIHVMHTSSSRHKVYAAWNHNLHHECTLCFIITSKWNE